MKKILLFVCSMLFTVAAMAQKSIEFTFVVNFLNIFLSWVWQPVMAAISFTSSGRSPKNVIFSKKRCCITNNNFK